MAHHAAAYRPLSLEVQNSTQQTKGRFKRLLITSVLLIPSLAILGGLLVLCLFGINFGHTGENFGCDPEGNVWVGRQNAPNVWSQNYGLSITLGFGSFSFSEAKTIDVLWDMIIGRGSQLFAGGLLYYTFRGPVVAMMHDDSVPHEKVLKMEYYPAGFSAWLSYCKDVRWKRRTGWQWFTTLMLATATAYILIMPTLVSAMTGYQPHTRPLLRTDETTIVPIADLKIAPSGAAVYKGRVFSTDEMASMGWCVPEKDYRWGFSLILLFMFLSVTWLLSIPLYLIYIVHYWRSHRQVTATDEVFGTLRAPLAVAAHIRRELGGLHVERMSEKEIKDMLGKRGLEMSLRPRTGESEIHRLQQMSSRPSTFRSRTSTLSASSSRQTGRSQSETSFL